MHANTFLYLAINVLAILIGAGAGMCFMLKRKVTKQTALYASMLMVLCVFCLGLSVKFSVAPYTLQLGFNSTRGIVGLALSLAICRVLFRTDLKNIAYSAIASAPLMYAIAKIACAVNGCCAGIAYSGPLAIMHDGAPRFPIQLVESLVFFGIFIFAAIKNKKDKAIRAVVLLSFASKFALDFLREEHGSPLSKNQIILTVFAILGVVIINNSEKILGVLDKTTRKEKNG